MADVPLPPARPASLDASESSSIRKQKPEDSLFELFAYVQGKFTDPNHLFYGSVSPPNNPAEKKLKEILGSTFPLLHGEKRIPMNKLTNNPALERQTVAAMKFFGASPMFKVAIDQILPKRIAQFSGPAHGGGAGAFNLQTNTLFQGAQKLESIIGKMLGGSAYEYAEDDSALKAATKSISQQVGKLAGLASGIETAIETGRPDQLIGVMQNVSKVFAGTDKDVFSADVFVAGQKMAQAVTHYMEVSDLDPNGFLGAIDHIGDVTNALSVVESLGYRNTIAALTVLDPSLRARLDPQGLLVQINPNTISSSDAKRLIITIGSGSIVLALQQSSPAVKSIVDKNGVLNLFTAGSFALDVASSLLEGFDLGESLEENIENTLDNVTGGLFGDMKGKIDSITGTVESFQERANSLSSIEDVADLMQDAAGVVKGIPGVGGQAAAILNNVGNLVNQAGQLVNKAGDIIDQIEKLDKTTAMNPAKLLSQIETAQQVGRLF